jgi:hypothetical protein
MVKDFELWAQSRPTLPPGVEQTFFRNYGDTALMELSGGDRTGRISVWESGAVELESQDIRAGKQTFYLSQVYRTWQDAFPEVRAFLNSLKPR